MPSPPVLNSNSNRTMSNRILKNRYGYDTGTPPRRRPSNREAAWKQARYIGANGSGAAGAAAGLSTSMAMGIATLVTVVALAIAFIATSATMFPALLKDIDKLEHKSELCFCDKFDSDVFGLIKPDNPMIEVQFSLSNLTLNGTYLYTFPDQTGILALLGDIPLVPTSFSDADFFLFNAVDNSKQARFDVSLLTATTNQTYSFPNLSGTFALTTGVQSLSDKTLTSATITSATNVVHASHLRTLTTAVDVSLATAPTPGQVLTYNGAIGNWQTPIVTPTTTVTTGNFSATGIVGFGPWLTIPTSVRVDWTLIDNTTLIGNVRWDGGEVDGLDFYEVTFDIPWILQDATYGTLNVIKVDPPNSQDIPWYITPWAPGVMSTAGNISLLPQKNVTGFGNFQGLITGFV